MTAEAATVENEVARNLLDVGNKLRSPPSDAEELVKLLNLAEDFLSQVEQAPPASLSTALYRVLKALVAKDLLNHSDMDVKIALASCFSEITFITAPAHPYNEDLMKDIFQIIIDALKNIDDSSSRTYYRQVSILETIAKVHSCVLMLDLDCDDLILEMFQHFLKTITPDNEGRVFSFMETIMTELINDSEDKLLPCLLESLVKDIKDGLPIARRLVEKVIRNCAAKLKPYLIELVRSNGCGDIIASICQENYDISEMNLPSTSGECLVSEAESREKELDEALVGSKIKVWWPDDQDLNVVKGKDPIWEHCGRVAGNDRWKFKCFHCSKVISDLVRMKHHLARTGNGMVQSCTHASEEVEKLFADIVSQKKPTKYVTSLDPTWEHCEKEDGHPSWKFKCLYCSKIVWGIRRMKYHLARANKISTPCSSCPKEVEDFFFNLISQLESGK